MKEIYDSYKIILCGITKAGHDHYSALKTAAGYLSNTYTNDVSIYTGSVLPSTCNSYLQSCKVFASRSHGEANTSGQIVNSTGIVTNDLSGANCNGFYSNNFPSITSGSYYIHSYDLYSDLGLALFIGCKTGLGGDNANNLPSRVVSQGATCAVGFKEDLNCSNANQWTEYFFEFFCDGYDVYHSVYYASQIVSIYDIAFSLDNIVICGDDSYWLGEE